MAVGKKLSKIKDKYISTMDDKEIGLLSIITMSGGILSEIQLKRIYLEKFTLWELQATEKQLSDKGLLVKRLATGNEILDYVIPDDVKLLAPYVLTHRIIISPQTRLRGRTPEEVMMEIVESVPVPVEG